MLNKLLVVVLAGVLVAGCTTTRAATPVERPVLDVPPVPARGVEPAPTLTQPPPEPVADLPPAPANAPRPRPQPGKPDATKPVDPKLETPATDPAPATPPQPAAVVPPIRTSGSPEAAEAARQIEAMNARAQGILDTTHYQSLNRERQAQYQHAKLLISQAQDAVKAANYEFARNLAEKAERLAKELQVR